MTVAQKSISLNKIPQLLFSMQKIILAFIHPISMQLLMHAYTINIQGGPVGQKNYPLAYILLFIVLLYLFTCTNKLTYHVN